MCQTALEIASAKLTSWDGQGDIELMKPHPFAR
jgi:hypothetical protein